MNPLEIMDDLEEHPEIPIIGSEEWQSLRAAIESQAAELAQKDARIARLEAAFDRISWMAKSHAVQHHHGITYDRAQRARDESLAQSTAQATRRW